MRSWQCGQHHVLRLAGATISSRHAQSRVAEPDDCCHSNVERARLAILAHRTVEHLCRVIRITRELQPALRREGLKHVAACILDCADRMSGAGIVTVVHGTVTSIARLNDTSITPDAPKMNANSIRLDTSPLHLRVYVTIRVHSQLC